MKIRSFTTTAPIFPAVHFDDDKPICFFSGASIFLNMLRTLLDGDDDGTPIDAEKERRLVSSVSFELDGKDYELCSVLCDDQTFFIAANTEHGFSESETKVCLAKLRELRSDESNFYCIAHKYIENDNCLSESDYLIANFKKFLENLKSKTRNGDRRPIYIFNFFERIDEAVDIAPFLNELASNGRQVFISVPKNFSEMKTKHNYIQRIASDI